MTGKEEKDFRQMYAALRRITQYMTPARIERDAKKGVLDYEEYLGMAYENIQGEAKAGLKGIRLPKPPYVPQKGDEPCGLCSSMDPNHQCPCR